MNPRIFSLLIDIEELHRRFINADSKASIALDELLFAKELENVDVLVQLRASYLAMLDISQKVSTPYFVAIYELLNALRGSVRKNGIASHRSPRVP